MRGLRSASSAVAWRTGLPSFHSGENVTFLMRGRRTVSKYSPISTRMNSRSPPSSRFRLNDGVAGGAGTGKIVEDRCSLGRDAIQPLEAVSSPRGRTSDSMNAWRAAVISRQQVWSHIQRQYSYLSRPCLRQEPLVVDSPSIDSGIALRVRSHSHMRYVFFSVSDAAKSEDFAAWPFRVVSAGDTSSPCSAGYPLYAYCERIIPSHPRYDQIRLPFDIELDRTVEDA